MTIPNSTTSRRDIAVEHDGREAKPYRFLNKVIQSGCRAAIKLVEKV